MRIPFGRDKHGRSREWLHIGLAFGLCVAVLPCAPRARTQVGELPSNWPSASTKAAGHGRGERKVCENRRAFPSSKAKQSPVKGLLRKHDPFTSHWV